MSFNLSLSSLLCLQALRNGLQTKHLTMAKPDQMCSWMKRTILLSSLNILGFPIRATVEKIIKKCNNFCFYLHLSIISANGSFLFSASWKSGEMKEKLEIFCIFSRSGVLRLLISSICYVHSYKSPIYICTLIKIQTAFSMDSAPYFVMKQDFLKRPKSYC